MIPVYGNKYIKQGALEPPSSGLHWQIMGRVKKCLKETLVCPDSVLMLNILRFRIVCEKVMWWVPRMVLMIAVIKHGIVIDVVVIAFILFVIFSVIAIINFIFIHLKKGWCCHSIGILWCIGTCQSCQFYLGNKPRLCTHINCTGWHQKKPMCTPLDTTTFIVTSSWCPLLKQQYLN